MKETSRSGLPRPVREARSKLAQLLHAGDGLLRGTLLVRQIVCGKPNCKCARGERHAAHVLAASFNGRQRQLSVPGAMVPTVEAWIARHREMRDLLETLSRAYWEKVKNREV